MTAYCALNCDTIIEVNVHEIGAGAGRVPCFECEGDGNWGKFAPEIVGSDGLCVDCKGTGFILISV